MTSLLLRQPHFGGMTFAASRCRWGGVGSEGMPGLCLTKGIEVALMPKPHLCADHGG